MSIQIVLDKPRELKFDIRATKDLEQALGKPLGDIISDLMSVSVTAMTVALWAGLKHQDKALTPNLATKLFEQYIHDRKSLRLLITALTEAIEETGLFDTNNGEPEGNEQPEPVA